MRIRTGAALVAVLTLACEGVPTNAIDGVGARVVLDLSSAGEFSNARVGERPIATNATLFWEHGGRADSIQSPVIQDRATFNGITVPKGRVTFWADATSESRTVLHWSNKVTFDIQEDGPVSFGLVPIYPLPRIRILDPTETIPGQESNIQLANVGRGGFEIEIRNARDPSPVLDSAAAVGHPIELTWGIGDDPHFDFSATSGTLGPGDTTIVTVTEKPQFSDTTISADLDVTFYFVTESDSFQPEMVQAREAAIALIKTTNIDTLSWHPPGPIYGVGDALDFTYSITNTGTISLSGLSLTDSLAHRPDTNPAFAVACPALDRTLQPGDTVTCTAPADTVSGGLYQNVARVTAATGFGTLEVSAADTNWHQSSGGPCLTLPGTPCGEGGDAPSVAIEVSTNGHDADAPRGLHVFENDRIVWGYVVTNDGKWPLEDVVVMDDALNRQIPCPQSLAVGARAVCTPQRGIAVKDLYATVGTVKAKGRDPATGLLRDVFDQDPSHYFGNMRPSPDTVRIDIEKTTNTVQADTGPGPALTAGDTVRWRYVVTNTGNVGLSNIAVTDSDPSVDPICSQVPVTLDPGDSIYCSAPGEAVAGQYGNEGTATGTSTGTSPSGALAMDTDSSHYIGSTPITGAIGIEKRTNGVEADVGPGPSIPVGNTVVWTYVVTNLGQSDLGNVTVTDSDPALTVGCPQMSGTLAPGDSITCEARGVAVPDLYGNEGAATAVPVGGTDPVMDTDSSHYRGVGMQSSASASELRREPIRVWRWFQRE